MLSQRYSRSELNPRLPENGTGKDCSLLAYCRRSVGMLGERGGRWAVILCPGGGYEMISPAEGEPVALELLARGVQAFVLRYSLSPARYPQQLLELAAAVAFVRAHAEEFGVSRVAVAGFSAGGHLAASLADLWQENVLTDTLGGSAELYRPDAVILGYPVISTGPEFGCAGCVEKICAPEQLEKLSLERSEGPQVPPAFLWCTVDDPVVPMENTLSYAGALRRAGVPFEAHLFQHGPHAMAAATADSAFDAASVDPHAAHWIELCVEWLKTLGEN